MKNKGFTLVEVLAMLVVLGIIVGITMPNITGILENQKVNTIIGDAKKMINSAKTEVLTNNDVYLPKENNQCVVLDLSKIDKNSDIKADADDEEYDRVNSFILIKFKDKKYEYHVRLAAKRSDDKYYGILDATESDLSHDDTSYIKEFNKTDIKSLSNGVNLTSFSGDSSFNSCKFSIIYSGEDINSLSNDEKFFCYNGIRRHVYMRRNYNEMIYMSKCFKYKEGTTWNEFLNSKYNEVNDDNVIKEDNRIISLKDYIMYNDISRMEDSMERKQVLKRETESTIKFIFNKNSGVSNEPSIQNYLVPSIPNCFEDYGNTYKCEKDMLNTKIKDSSQGYYVYDPYPRCGSYEGELC